MHEPLVPMLFPVLGEHISSSEFLYPDLSWDELCSQMVVIDIIIGVLHREFRFRIVFLSGQNSGQNSVRIQSELSQS